MRAIALFLMMFLTFNGYSQSRLPDLGNFQYQTECLDKFIFGYYLTDTTFNLIIEDSERGEIYLLSGKMTFHKNIVTLQYLENRDNKFPGFKVGKEEHLLIERRGERLVPTEESYIICHYLEKAEVRY